MWTAQPLPVAADSAAHHLQLRREKGDGKRRATVERSSGSLTPRASARRAVAQWVSATRSASA